MKQIFSQNESGKHIVKLLEGDGGKASNKVISETEKAVNLFAELNEIESFEMCWQAGDNSLIAMFNEKDEISASKIQGFAIGYSAKAQGI